MNFDEMYRVLIKREGKFVGTGSTKDGQLTAEGNLINQNFYAYEKALEIKSILEKDGFEVKVSKGGK